MPHLAPSRNTVLRSDRSDLVCRAAGGIAMKVIQRAAPLRQEVVRLIRQEILDGGLLPGKRLRENDLCERYGVSRTVVREALRQLESESLITLLPNRGPIVTVLTSDDIVALYEVRCALEGLAGELFARCATSEEACELVAHLEDMETTYLHGDLASRGESKERFYELLLGGGHNPVLASTLQGIHSRVAMFRHYAFVDDKRVALSMEELRRIVHCAAVERNAKRARKACEDHIRLAGQLAVIEYERRYTTSKVAI
jgi:DNA-binding GntR family transcriptional regulator